MTTQPEQVLENNLVKQLQDLGHKFVNIKDEKGLYANLKTQLEKHNKINFSEREFLSIFLKRSFAKDTENSDDTYTLHVL